MPNELIFYKIPDGEQRIEVVHQDESFWMPQWALAELFAVGLFAILKFGQKETLAPINHKWLRKKSPESTQ